MCESNDSCNTFLPRDHSLSESASSVASDCETSQIDLLEFNDQVESSTLVSGHFDATMSPRYVISNGQSFQERDYSSPQLLGSDATLQPDSWQLDASMFTV